MKNKFDVKGFTVFAIVIAVVFCVTEFCCSPKASAAQQSGNTVQCVLQDVKYNGSQAYIAGMPCVMDNETAALAFQIKRRGGTAQQIECCYTVENGVATLHLK